MRIPQESPVLIKATHEMVIEGHKIEAHLEFYPGKHLAFLKDAWVITE
jgi:hypothetical protein